jgi:hypothetical protein
MKPIRWRAEDLAEFARIRKNYNAKIARLQKTLPADQAALLPPKLQKSDIYSRADFNRVKRMNTMFTAPGSNEPVKFKGQVVPKFFKQQLQYMTKVENAKRAAARKEMTPERGTFTMGKEAAYAPFELKKKTYTPQELKKRYDAMEIKLLDSDLMKKQQRYKEIYMEAVKTELGAMGQPIIDLIKDIPPDVFAKSLKGEYELNAAFVSDMTDLMVRGSAIYEKWAEFIQQNLPGQYDAERVEEALAMMDGYDITDLMAPYEEV